MATEPSIGTSIKRARERKRWTQRQLADALGVNVKSVDNWENGRTSPRSSIGALEEVLGVDLTAGDGGEPELVPSDDWEASVLADPYLDDEVKVSLVRESRAARAEYVRLKRERAERERQEAARSSRGTAAG